MFTATPRRSQHGRPALELLESRLVLSPLVPSPPIVANTVPVNLGESENPYPPIAIASDARGDFVVVWTTATVLPSTGSQVSTILARRFNAKGVPIDQNPITVVDNIVNFSPDIAVGMDSAGDFVVAYDNQNGENEAIFAVRFDSTGQALDSNPFQVSDPSLFDAAIPSVALDNAGHFYVVYEGLDNGFNQLLELQEGNTSGPNPFVGTPIILSTYSESSGVSFVSQSIASDSSGNLVVAYENLFALRRR